MDATDKKAFADWVRQVTLTGYKARHEFKRVCLLPDCVMNDIDVKALKPLGNGVEISDYLMRHGIRPKKNERHSALSLNHLERLPELVDSARWIYDAKHKNIIGFFEIDDEQQIGKAVVMFNYDRKGGKHNAIVTTGIVNKVDTKAGWYREIRKER